MGTPSAALAVQQPPSPLDQVAKLVSLKSLLGQQQLQQSMLAGEQQRQAQASQLFPTQLAGQQAQASSLQTEAQQRQLQLQSMQGVRQALLDAQRPTQPNQAPAGSGPEAPWSAPEPAPGGGGDIWQRFQQNLQDPKYGVLPSDALAYSKQFTDLATSHAQMTKAQSDAAQAVNDLAVRGIQAIKQALPEDQAATYTLIRNEMARSDNPAVQEAASKMPPQFPGMDALNTLMAASATVQDLATFQKQQNEAGGQIAGSALAQQKADIVAQLSTPEALASPGAQAAIQAKIADPSTNPADVPRLRLLLPKAEVAQHQASTLKARDEQAQQVISQGDPDAAGRLLASRALTLDELKLRNATPQFMEKAVAAAQKYDPSFKAAESSAQGRIAGNEANQQFFGNTDSLLIKNGTLDQLQASAAQLNAGKFPALNSIAQWTSLATGASPMARFAAAALGVADDYSKVMTGSGQGSDTSRLQALNIIKAAQSPQQMQAAINQIRQQVASQRAGRIGSNPYLADMYPDPTKAPGAAEPQRTPQAPPPAAGFVRMRGPDGSIADVPAANVGAALKAGATRIQQP